MKLNYLLIITILHFSTIITLCENKILIPEKIIVIEENDSCIINGLRDFDISSDEKLFAIINKTGTMLMTYSIDDCKLRNHFNCSDSLNSTLLDKSDYWYDRQFKNYLLAINDLAEKVGYKRSNIRNTISTLFFDANNNIICGGTMRAVALDTARKKSVLANIGGIFIFDNDLNLKYGSPLESNNYEYSMLVLYYPFTDSTFLSTVSNFSTNNPDSMTFISEYNINGKHKRLIEKLPNDYTSSGINYSASLYPSMVKVKNKYFYTTMYDYKIRELSSDFSFETVGLDSTNKSAFIKLKENKINIVSEKKDERKIFTQTGKLGVLHDSLIMVYITDKESHVQLYNTKGELQRDYILSTKPEQKLTNVAFGKKSKNIYAISLDDENYYLSIYRMEE